MRNRSDVIRDTVHYMSPASGRSVVEVTAVVPSHSGLEVAAWDLDRSRDASAQVTAAQSARVSRSLLLVKPIAVCYAPVVERKLLQQGFHVMGRRLLQLTAEQVCEFLEDPCGELGFPYSVLSCSNAPVLAMCVAAVDAVPRLHKLVGTGDLPYSWFWPWAISRRFGYMDTVPDALLASANEDVARSQIRFFFPTMVLEPLLHTETQVEDFLERTVKRTLLAGLTELCKRKPTEPLLYLAEWLMLNNPYYPKVDPEIAKLPN